MDMSISKKTTCFKTSIYTLQIGLIQFPVSIEASLYFMLKENRYLMVSEKPGLATLRKRTIKKIRHECFIWPLSALNKATALLSK